MRHFHRLGQLISCWGELRNFSLISVESHCHGMEKMVDYTADIHKLLKIDIAAEESCLYYVYPSVSVC